MVDVDSGGAVSVDIVVEKMDGSQVVLRAPCLLPELTTVHAVHLSSSSSSSSLSSSSAAASAATTTTTTTASSSPGGGATDPSLYYPTSLVITPKQQQQQQQQQQQPQQPRSTATNTPVEPSELSFEPHVLFVKRRPVTSTGFAPTKTTQPKALGQGLGQGAKQGQSKTIVPSPGLSSSSGTGTGAGTGTIHELQQNLLVRLVGSKAQQQGLRWIQEGAGETQMHLGQHTLNTPSQ